MGRKSLSSISAEVSTWLEPTAPAAWWARTASYALVVVCAWAGLELWGLGNAPFHTNGESREALVVWEITHGGGWVLPRRNGTELPSKPPLFHWLGALTSLAHGATDEWSIRFPSAALSLVSLLCVFAAGAALWNPRTGLFSALALMTMFEWARAATGARVDITLTCGLQLAFLSALFFLRHRAAVWLVPLYVGVTVAVLGKGPVGVALPAAVVLAALALRRDFSPVRQMRLGTGALGVGVVAGTWYALALFFGGYAFFRKQVLAENVFRVLGSSTVDVGHHHAVPYLAGALLLGVLPWTIFLPSVAAKLWRQRHEIAREDARAYLLIWIGVVFGFYALAASKRGVYLLALYPALALLIGRWWDERCHAITEDESWLAWLLEWLTWPLLAVLCIIATVVALERLGAPVVGLVTPWLSATAQPFAPWVTDTIRVAGWALLGCLTVAGAACMACRWAARKRYWVGVFVALFAAVTALTISVGYVILPEIARHQSARTLIANVRQIVGPSDSLAFYHTFDYGAVFYWQGHIPTYSGPLSDSAPRYLLIDKRVWAREQPAVSGLYERITFAHDPTASLPKGLVLIRRTAEG
jgi:4-amino-4-deoxy-L-arabinose transferase-like glycosyltransferase